MTRRSTAIGSSSRKRRGDEARLTATIRPAKQDEHAVLEALLARASLATGENVEALLANPDALTIPSDYLSHSLVAEWRGQILGFCIVLPVFEGHAEIDAVFVEPASWRLGLGRLLLAAERRVASMNVTVMSVVSDRYAEPFYVSQGFRRLSAEMTRFGPAIRLEKPLTDRLSPAAAAVGAGTE